MSTFAVERLIVAPIEDVWNALADIGSIHLWNPGVEHSYTTSNETTGLGASRHCDLRGGNYLKESVVEYEEAGRLTMRVDDTNLPFDSIDIRFRLLPDEGGTRVSVQPEYRMRFGLLGRLLDRFYVHRTYRRGMEALLEGLKEHVEAIG